MTFQLWTEKHVRIYRISYRFLSTSKSDIIISDEEIFDVGLSILIISTQKMTCFYLI